MNKSIFEKVSFKPVLIVFAILLALNIADLLNIIPDKENTSAIFLYVAIGFLVIGCGIFAKNYDKKERIVFTLIGIALLTEWLSKIRLVMSSVTIPVSMCLKIGSLYLLWLVYKNSPHLYKKSKSLLGILLLVIAILLLPAIFFWILGILSGSIMR